ncbi:hypothetical protein [Romboutsia sp.]|uniref:hypothetical protein n=1 Tax=Romboutsia sp. TaxID=1965302 RepID=UPI002BF711FB|nr:hypothetical protein [Romboutsia sp.]HSQ89771.1 hypothetical protein [Romboutsia sp.]
MKKIYMVYEGKIEEVEVLKETQKQFKLGDNRKYRRILNKTELDIPLEFTSFDIFGSVVFSEDKEKATEIYNNMMNDTIKFFEKRLGKYNRNIIY